MSDIKLTYVDGGFDVFLKDNDLEQDEGLKTAIIISLFSDRRVTVAELPYGQSDQRGWWADVATDEADPIGSKLWLLEREKITPEVLKRAREYCEEALKWLIDDGIAEKIRVVVERTGLQSVGIYIEIWRRNEKMSQKYDIVWKNAA